MVLSQSDGKSLSNAEQRASAVDLLLFTCEGREHLLQSTVRSLSEAVDYQFANRIIAADGAVSLEEAPLRIASLFINRIPRAGYVRNIVTALRQVEAPYFFWLEDDWKFEAPVPFKELVGHLEAHPDWVQIRLSKSGPLSEDQRISPLTNGVFGSTVGFSANPCVCRTKHVRDGFEALLAAPKGNRLGEHGFEDFLTRWCQSRGLVCAVYDSPGVEHQGYLESTSRSWHMTASLDGPVADNMFTLGSRPSPIRRALMIAHLIRRFCWLALRQLTSDVAYETAFRVVTLDVEESKSKPSDHT